MSTGTETAAPVTTAPAAETPETNTPDTPAVPQTPPKTKAEIYSRIAERANAKVNERFEPVAKRVFDRHKETINMRRVFGDDDGRKIVVDVFTDLIALLTTPTTLSDPNDPNSPKVLVKGTTVGLPAGLGSIELLTAGATKKKTPQGAVIDVEERWRMKWNPGKAVDDVLEKLPKPTPTVKPAKPEDSTPAQPDAPTAAAPAQPVAAAAPAAPSA